MATPEMVKMEDIDDELEEIGWMASRILWMTSY